MTTPAGTISLNQMHVEAGELLELHVVLIPRYKTTRVLPVSLAKTTQMRSKTRGYLLTLWVRLGVLLYSSSKSSKFGIRELCWGVGSVLLFGTFGSWAGSDTTYKSAFTATGHDSYITVIYLVVAP